MQTVTFLQRRRPKARGRSSWKAPRSANVNIPSAAMDMDNATMGNARLLDQRVGRATPPPQTCERRNKQMEEQRNRVQRASDKTCRRF